MVSAGEWFSSEIISWSWANDGHCDETKSLCHFCIGEWMPAWRPNSKTLVIFAHGVIFFFLLPCRHQRLQQLDKLPGLHLGGKKTPSYNILSDWKSFVVIYMCSCSLSAENLTCLCQLTGPSSSSLPWLLCPEAKRTFYWELLEQCCVTSYSTQRLTLMLIGHCLSTAKSISLAKTDWWENTSVFPARREAWCRNSLLLPVCYTEISFKVRL